MDKTEFDNLSVEENIRIVNEFASRITDAMLPVLNRTIKVFQELGKTFSVVANSVFTDDFKNKYIREVKKERHRKRYCRMVARRTK